MANAPETITVDGTEYRYADLSESARQQIHNVSMVDREIARLKKLQALEQTARNAYAQALGEALPRESH